MTLLKKLPSLIESMACILFTTILPCTQTSAQELLPPVGHDVTADGLSAPWDGFIASDESFVFTWPPPSMSDMLGTPNPIIKVWEARTNRLFANLQGPAKTPNDFAYSVRQGRLYAISEKTLWAWDVRSAQLLARIPVMEYARKLCLHDETNRLVIADDHFNVYVINSQTFLPTSFLQFKPDDSRFKSLESLDFDGPETLVAVYAQDSLYRIAANSGQILSGFSLQDPDSTSTNHYFHYAMLDVAHEALWLFSRGAHTLAAKNIRTGDQLDVYKLPGDYAPSDLRPCGKNYILFSLGSGNECYLINRQDKALHPLSAHIPEAEHQFYQYTASKDYLVQQWSEADYPSGARWKRIIIYDANSLARVDSISIASGDYQSDYLSILTGHTLVLGYTSWKTGISALSTVPAITDLRYPYASNLIHASPISLPALYRAMSLDSNALPQAVLARRVFRHYPDAQQRAPFVISPRNSYGFTTGYQKPRVLFRLHIDLTQGKTTADTVAIFPKAYYPGRGLIHFSPDENWLGTSADSTVTIISNHDGQVLGEKRIGSRLNLPTISLWNNGSFYVANADSLLRFDTKTRQWRRYNMPDNIVHLSSNKSGHVLTTVVANNNLPILGITPERSVYELNPATSTTQRRISMSAVFLGALDSTRNRIFAMQRNGSIQMMDAATGKLLRTFGKPNVADTMIPFYADALMPMAKPCLQIAQKEMLLSYTYDQVVRLWNTATGELIFESGLVSNLTHVEVDEKQSLIIGLEEDRMFSDAEANYKHLYVWSYKTGVLLFSDSTTVTSAKKSPPAIIARLLAEPLEVMTQNGIQKTHLLDFRQVISASEDRRKFLLSYGSVAAMVTLKPGEVGVAWYALPGEHDATISDDGEKLMVPHHDSFSVIDGRTGSATAYLLPGIDNISRCITAGEQVIFETGKYSEYSKRDILVWNTTSGSLVYRVSMQNGINGISIACSPDGRYLFTRNDLEGMVHDVTNNKQIGRWEGRNDGTFFSPDGQYLIVRDYSRPVSYVLRLADATWQEITLSASTPRYIDGGYVQDGAYLVNLRTGNKQYIGPDPLIALQGTMRYQIAAMGITRAAPDLATPVDMPVTHAGMLIGAWPSPDGAHILTLGDDGKLMKWNQSDGHFEGYATLPAGALRELWFNTDSTCIIATDDAGGTEYSMTTLRQRFAFTPGSAGRMSYFLPEGQYLAGKQDVRQYNYRRDGKLYDFSLMDARYNRPDLVYGALNPADTAGSRIYEASYRRRIKRLGIQPAGSAAPHPPTLSLQNRERIPRGTPEDAIMLDIVADGKDANLSALHITVNDVPVYGKAGKPLQGAKTINEQVRIPLNAGANKIKVHCINSAGVESLPEQVMVFYQPVQPPSSRTVFIGIAAEQYRNATMNLHYAAKDIHDLARAFRQRFPDADTITLYNEQVTTANILALKERLAKTGIEDRVVLAFSGHGLLDDSLNFYCATYDVDFRRPRQGGLPYEELEGLLDGIPARRKLLLIDACHSGEVDKDEFRYAKADGRVKGYVPSGARGAGMVNTGADQSPTLQTSFELMQELFADLSNSSGAVVISAAGGQEYALEDAGLSNGVFTYSVLQAMGKDEGMKVSELKDFVSGEVVRLTGGRQRPTARRENLEWDWGIW